MRLSPLGSFVHVPMIHIHFKKDSGREYTRPTPDGYSGPIDIGVGVRRDGNLNIHVGLVQRGQLLDEFLDRHGVASLGMGHLDTHCNPIAPAYGPSGPLEDALDGGDMETPPVPRVDPPCVHLIDDAPDRPTFRPKL